MSERNDPSQFATTPEPFWAEHRRSGAGSYGVMELAAEHGWYPVGVWGRDGWNLGSWPYVIFFIRANDGRWEVAHYIEGDIATYAFPDQLGRDAFIDAQAFWYWKHSDAPWVSRYERVEQLPPRLRGPYDEQRDTTPTLVRMVLVPVDGPAQLWYVHPNLTTLVSIVDGPLQVVPLGQDAHAYCDEEGKLVRKAVNHLATAFWHAAVPEMAGRDVLCGDIVILGRSGSEEADCPQWVIDGLGPHLSGPHTD